MKVEIQMDPNYQEPKLVIYTASVTEEIQHLVGRLSEEEPFLLCGYRGERMEILDPEQVFRMYASGGKVLATTEQGEYTLRLRLYELEQQLHSPHFIRISHSEIVNLKQVEAFDFTYAGTILIRLRKGLTTTVSRRYLPKLKKRLGI